MNATVSVVVLLLVWGTFAGLDLATLLQGLLTRPLVSGSVTGVIVGDVEAGLRIGAVLELFALDVVPVGGSRYPDYGAATVAAVLSGAHTDWIESLGLSVGIGLVLARLGGDMVVVLRRINARTVGAKADLLAQGDARAVAEVHWAGFRHDIVRSALLAVLAVAVGFAVRALPALDPGTGRLLGVIALGGAFWAVMHGAVASARHERRWRWLVGGLAVGLVAALV
ncbi:MAG: PTS sugar transporter subunit IIC [Gemmatimonadota bacterium]